MLINVFVTTRLDFLLHFSGGWLITIYTIVIATSINSELLCKVIYLLSAIRQHGIAFISKHVVNYKLDSITSSLPSQSVSVTLLCY